jgi:hypothetical protein
MGVSVSVRVSVTMLVLALGVVVVVDFVHGRGQDDHGDCSHGDHRSRLLMPRRPEWRLVGSSSGY